MGRRGKHRGQRGRGRGQRRGRRGRRGPGTRDVLAQLAVLLAQGPQQLEDAALLHQGQLVVRVVVDEVAHGARGVALHLLVGVVEELHQPGHGLEAAGLRAGAHRVSRRGARLGVRGCVQACGQVCTDVCRRVGRCADVCRCAQLCVCRREQRRAFICRHVQVYADLSLLPLPCRGGSGQDGVCPVSQEITEGRLGTSGL